MCFTKVLACVVCISILQSKVGKTATNLVLCFFSQTGVSLGATALASSSLTDNINKVSARTDTARAKGSQVCAKVSKNDIEGQGGGLWYSHAAVSKQPRLLFTETFSLKIMAQTIAASTFF